MTQPIKSTVTTVNTYDLEDVVHYIIESEYEDFQENPSEAHVYFKAVSLLEGRKVAMSEMDDALNNLEIKMVERGML